MRILLLCDQYPDNYRHGLLLRVLHFMRQLNGRHSIDLLCFHAGLVAGEPVALFRNIWTVKPPIRKVGGGLASMLGGWDPRDLYPRSPEAVALLERSLSPSDYDAVWDAGACMFLHLPPSWNDVPLVVDLVDDMVLTFRRALSGARGIAAKLRVMKYIDVQRRFERDCMRRAAHCCVVSDDDADTFREVSPSVPVSVVQNGVDMEYFTPGICAEKPGRLVFEGSMAFGPNQDAAVFLVRDVMPRIWAQRPDASLTLVGRDPSPQVLALASARVTVTGVVDDIRPFVHDAQVFVCPLMSGAGIKNKLLQAWAMGKAVVATSISVGGLGAKDGDNLLVRDDADAIAQGVLRLLSDDAQRQRLGARGRETVVASFSWRAKAEAFEALLLDAGNRSR